jgi:hypothetical protein
VAHGVQQYHAYGHSGSMAQVDSTTSPTTSNYGVAYPTGTTIPVRGDFDTLDNPFYYTSDPTGDHYSNKKAAGLHFIMFQPTIAIFNRIRLAMDGHYSDKTLGVAPRTGTASIPWSPPLTMQVCEIYIMRTHLVWCGAMTPGRV